MLDKTTMVPHSQEAAVLLEVLAELRAIHALLAEPQPATGVALAPEAIEPVAASKPKRTRKVRA
jgi:hypothetical protein